MWEEGFRSGELKAPLFPDVAPKLQSWKDSGRRLVIFSSGSVAAQKLFFGHTDAGVAPDGRPGDLTPWISGWFDTVNAGPKTVAESYYAIVQQEQPDGGEVHGEWLFLSDNVKEVDAAVAAGMQSLVVTRPGNPPLPEDLTHTVVSSFDDITLDDA